MEGEERERKKVWHMHKRVRMKGQTVREKRERKKGYRKERVKRRFRRRQHRKEGGRRRRRRGEKKTKGNKEREMGRERWRNRKTKR